MKNFMFHTMLDAAGVVLKVHYKSMKCGVSFSFGCYSDVAVNLCRFVNCAKMNYWPSRRGLQS